MAPEQLAPPSVPPAGPAGKSTSGDNNNNNNDGADSELERHILQLALANAAAHNGRTGDRIILGKILGARRDLRGSIPAVSAIISETVKRVNAMSVDEQLGLLNKDTGETSATRDPSEDAAHDSGGDLPGSWLPPLDGAVDGEVVTRFPPEPNGYPHIGHAKAAIINIDYARKYGGKCLLRIDDTNPETERKEYLAGINVGLEWLGLEFADIKYTSDDIETLYAKGESLILSDKAYVCTCKKDHIGRNRRERKECKCCKRVDADEHYKRWNKMHTKFKSGEAVVRFRGDMTSDNAVMRDPVLFRIIGIPHYRQGSKYRVWPSYDMAVAIEDSMHGVTDAFRSKEFESRAQLIDAILDALDMRKPRQHYFARLAFDGMPTSKRMIKPLMEDGRIVGYDDPRIPTLGGLERRGIRPGAVRKFIESLGMTKADTVAPFETLEALNRRMIDGESERLFMVRDAKRLVIDDIPDDTTLESEMNRHPLRKEMGRRKMHASRDLYISGSDFENIAKGHTVRLLNLAYVHVTEKIADTDAKGRIYERHAGVPVNYTSRHDRDDPIAMRASYMKDAEKDFTARDKLEYYKKHNVHIPDEKNLEAEAAGSGKQRNYDHHIQWVSRKTAVPIMLTIPKKPFDGEEFDTNSLEEAEVYTEPRFHDIKEGAEIQFVRFGYCRKDTGRRVIFTHS